MNAYVYVILLSRIACFTYSVHVIKSSKCLSPICMIAKITVLNILSKMNFMLYDTFIINGH